MKTQDSQQIVSNLVVLSPNAAPVDLSAIHASDLSVSSNLWFDI